MAYRHVAGGPSRQPGVGMRLRPTGRWPGAEARPLAYLPDMNLKEL